VASKGFHGISELGRKNFTNGVLDDDESIRHARYALRSFLEFRFRVPAIPMFADGFVVFGAKFGAELLCPLFRHVNPQRNANRQNDAHDEDQHGRIEGG
jgi:hypothetical protein